MLRNALGVGESPISRKKVIRRCKVQFISITRGWVGVQYPEKKRYVTLER